MKKFIIDDLTYSINTKHSHLFPDAQIVVEQPHQGRSNTYLVLDKDEFCVQCLKDVVQRGKDGNSYDSNWTFDEWISYYASDMQSVDTYSVKDVLDAFNPKMDFLSLLVDEKFVNEEFADN